LRELLGNLFRNSVTHGGDDTGVSVTVGTLAEAEGFYVADDGPGIPPEERDSVFEHGYTTSDAGSGLGLTIVDRIASAHGWTVTVTDSAAGGARFETLTGRADRSR
jgi:signal transduction histidine kinase